MLRKAVLLLCAWCVIVGSPSARADSDCWKSMDFEVEGAWLTAPNLLDEFNEQDLLATRVIPFERLAGGVELSRAHVKSGRFSGRWSDHPRYPTIHTTRVPGDWSRFKALTFWVHSEKKTGEAITLAVKSDGDKTAWQDYFIHTFKVDWTGWRKFAVCFSDFERYGEPAGWNKIDAVYFFTKIFDRQPNPYTVLYIDDMKLDENEAPSAGKDEPAAKREGRLQCREQVPKFDPAVLNHPYPEVRGDRPVTAPIRYEPYFKAERALYGYYPRFQPGFVSFSPQGRAYIQYGAYIIETLGEDGRWTYRNLLDDVIEPYAREKLKFAALGVCNTGQTNDASIRFDKDGDAYMLCYIWDTTKDWRSRRGLLLHSRDGLKTWKVYELPCYMARFEKFVGHNRDCLDRPPVILLSRYFAPTTNSLLIPEKQPDGSLVIPEPVKVADGAIPFVPHSGEANNAVTHGGKVFLVYGLLKVLPGHEDKDGVPAYAVTYDIETRTLSKPVLVGFGGITAKDNHNWPSIAVDGKGILHVIINGHHNPFVYVRSTKPYDITAWTKPETVARGTSYGGLLCDKDDTLYVVTRNSYPGYYFRLSLHRKKAGRPWEEPRHLVIPFKPYYKIWYHKLTIDPATGRLFLSYYSQSGCVCLFKDEFLAYTYIWPDREKPFITSAWPAGRHAGEQVPRIPIGTCRTRQRKYQHYLTRPSEMTILVSEDAGETWHLATTEDFEYPFRRRGR